MSSKPSDLDGLFKFYHDFVKPLYSEVQAENVLPQEVLFEINAAFDHISRIYTYKDIEADAVEKAYSHLKRSCLDIFKLRAKKALDQYDQLLKIDTSIIDNGDFDRKMHDLAYQIKRGAKDARSLEGMPLKPDEDPGQRFENWVTVHEKATRFEKEFFLHDKLEWAKKKVKRYSFKIIAASSGVSFLLGLVLEGFSGALSQLFQYFK